MSYDHADDALWLSGHSDRASDERKVSPPEVGGTDLMKLAEEIVDKLFLNGFGDGADRLVLQLMNGGDVGGWCKCAAVHLIYTELLKAGSLKRRET